MTLINPALLLSSWMMLRRVVGDNKLWDEADSEGSVRLGECTGNLTPLLISSHQTSSHVMMMMRPRFLGSKRAVVGRSHGKLRRETTQCASPSTNQSAALRSDETK